MEEEDTSYTNDGAVMNISWMDVDLDVVLDSGWSDHVMNVEIDAPGYSVRPSDGSRMGRGFIVGNGERVPNDESAQSSITLGDPRGSHSLGPRTIR